ncbi:molybdopterin dinucleotide binding domain-containing protein, partial [Providencia rettgeri]
EKNIQDIEAHPFETPSGKIEIFSKRLYDRNNRDIPALSHYVPAIEGPEDSLTLRYPLQLITWKGRNRANSTQFANPWLQEVQRQELWINPIDAKQRGIADGERVTVSNDRGTTMVPVKITQRIMPGVVALQAGAWWMPDEKGIDQGGCANVLTSARSTAMAHGNAHQTLLVEVSK